MDPISFLIICLLGYPISSWTNFSNMCIYRNLSIPVKLSTLLASKGSQYSTVVFFIHVKFVVMSLFSFLILVCTFSHLFLVNLNKTLLNSLIFSKNQMSVSLILLFCYSLFHSSLQSLLLPSFSCFRYSLFICPYFLTVYS